MYSGTGPAGRGAQEKTDSRAGVGEALLRQSGEERVLTGRLGRSAPGEGGAGVQGHGKTHLLVVPDWALRPPGFCSRAVFPRFFRRLRGLCLSRRRLYR